MSELDKIIEEIAKEHFAVETLQERKRDSFDFHDVHVNSIKSALKAAYKAGQQSNK